MGSKSDELRRLIGSLRHEAISERFFIVFEDLQQSISEALISEALQDVQHRRYQHTNLVSTIAKQGLKVFSALVWIHQEDKIISFIEHGELDSRLHMDKQCVRSIDNTVQDRFWNEVQWEYLPYHFLRDDFHRTLRSEILLPYMTDERRAEGASGELFKSTIHISQQSFFPKMVSTLLLLRRETELRAHYHTGQPYCRRNTKKDQIKGNQECHQSSF